MTLTTSDYQAPQATDVYSKAAVVEDVVHWHGHQGRTFNYSTKFALASGGISNFLGRSTSEQIHFISLKLATSTGGIDLAFYEDPTIDSVGTQQTPICLNRSNLRTTTLEIYSGTSVSDNGTFLYTLPLFGTKETASNTDISEWILNPGSDYLYSLENTTNSEVTIGINFGWYEIGT